MERLKNKDTVVPIAGTVFQEIADVDSNTFTSVYNVSVDSGDFVTSRVTSNGQHFTEISLDPLSASETQTVIEYKSPIKFPAYVEVECSVSQRTKGDYFVMELTDKDTSYVDLPTEYNIVASYTDNTNTLYTTGQTSTTLTVCLDAPFDGYLGSWVDIYGLVDNRFNYTNLNVATISSDRKKLTFSYSDEVAIASLTANPASVIGGKLKRQAKLMSAANAVGVRFSGTSATSLSLLSRFNSGSIKEFGTLTGSRLITVASSAPSYISGADGSVEITSISKFRLDVEPEQITLSDKPKDSGNSFNVRSTMSAVKPNIGNDYYIRLRGVSPLSISRPVAKIVKAEKLTATTTATITTAAPHGLVTGNYVTIKGIMDQSKFANTTSGSAVTVLTPTTFTVICGTAAIATSYGGAVILCNGSVDQQGILGATIQNIARDSLGFVTLTGSASWAGYGGVGEYVNIYGVRDSVSGADLGFDGVYRINNASTNIMRLEPVEAKDGFGNNLTPIGGVVNTTACGGIVIARTTFRSHDILLSSYNQTITKLIGQGTNRADLAVPVVNASGGSLAVSNGVSTTTGLSGLYINPSNVQIADIASTAIGTSANTTNISTTAGNAFQVNVQVTNISGTNPTYDFIVEETYDGTNWITLYQFERIESIGSFNSPILKSMGGIIRYRQVIGGTSTPTFTRAVRRMSLPLSNPKMIKRLMNRTIVLTTLNSVTESLFVDGTSNVQLLVKIGTATTVPSLQLQGSEDNVNWYNIGSSVQAVASGIASIITNNISAKFIRAIVDNAGNTVVAEYVCLKAWE